MSQFFANFFKTKHEVIETPSSSSLSYLKYKNYDRKLFTYDQLLDTSWWPDQILKFIEVCKITYIEFIQYFQNKASMFDTPLRNAIFFMSQKKYHKDHKEISDFIKHHMMTINDNYLISIIQEDNCFMDEYEDHLRSKNEAKHYSLLNAVIKLLTIYPIEYGGKQFKEKHKIILHIYVVIYKLKNMYAMMDDMLRQILRSFLIKESIHLHLPTIFETYIMHDIETQIMNHLKECDFQDKKYDQIEEEYKQLFRHVHKFKDLLLYALYQTLEFSSVFNPKDKGLSTLDDEKYKKLYTSKVKRRILLTYETYANKIKVQASRRQLILDGHKFDDLLKAKEHIDAETTASPQYAKKSDTLEEVYALYSDDMTDTKSPRKNSDTKPDSPLDRDRIPRLSRGSNGSSTPIISNPIKTKKKSRTKSDMINSQLHDVKQFKSDDSKQFKSDDSKQFKSDDSKQFKSDDSKQFKSGELSSSKKK